VTGLAGLDHRGECGLGRAATAAVRAAVAFCRLAKLPGIAAFLAGDRGAGAIRDASAADGKLRRSYGRASVPGYCRITVVPAQAGLESMRYAPPAVSNW
jgi:hypothetical protein